MKAIAVAAGVAFLVVVLALAGLEIMRRRGFDPVRAISRPFDPTTDPAVIDAEAANAAAVN
jgi:hypothetical protein